MELLFNYDGDGTLKSKRGKCGWISGGSSKNAKVQSKWKLSE